MFGPVRYFNCSVEGHEAIDQLGNGLAIVGKQLFVSIFVVQVKIVIENAVKLSP